MQSGGSSPQEAISIMQSAGSNPQEAIHRKKSAGCNWHHVIQYAHFLLRNSVFNDATKWRQRHDQCLTIRWSRVTRPLWGRLQRYHPLWFGTSHWISWCTRYVMTWESIVHYINFVRWSWIGREDSPKDFPSQNADILFFFQKSYLPANRWMDLPMGPRPL